MPIVFGGQRALEVVRADKEFFHFTRLGEEPSELVDCPACQGHGFRFTLSNWVIDESYCKHCDGAGQLTRNKADKVYARLERS